LVFGYCLIHEHFRHALLRQSPNRACCFRHGINNPQQSAAIRKAVSKWPYLSGRSQLPYRSEVKLEKNHFEINPEESK
jgi:hypothetical protein